jgi:DNA-directed RNA polymerase subunit F
MKKSFRDITPALQFISNAQEVQPVQRTQGKKGQKLPRINMAFQTSNLEYLQLISRIEGKSITEYVNNLVEQDRQRNAARLEEARSILKA